MVCCMILPTQVDISMRCKFVDVIVTFSWLPVVSCYHCSRCVEMLILMTITSDNYIIYNINNILYCYLYYGPCALLFW